MLRRNIPARTRRNLPAFALYGETGSPGPALLHIESIGSRSRLYGWEIDAHVHQGLHQVLWLRNGKVEAMLDETRTRCDGPVALVIPPGVAHAFRFSRHCEGYVLTVNAHLLVEGERSGRGEGGGLGAAMQALFAEPRLLPLDPDSPDLARLQPLFEALHAENHSADSVEGPVPLWLARALVWRLAMIAGRGLAHTDETGLSPSRLAGRTALYTKWVVMLEAHYIEHWPVSRYAERLGLSAERLNRMVRAETGRTAQALLHQRLAREASRRLVHVAAPVSRLAFELGFEDPAYFCRFFKRQTGLSPRAYRQKVQGA